MESKVIPQRILCSYHPDEIVIRVSLNLEEEKLFYCIECLKEHKGTLIKFQDVLHTLNYEYLNQSLADTEKTLPSQVKEVYINQSQIRAEVSKSIAEQKQRVDQELKKIEKQLVRLFRKVKEATHDSLDRYESTFNSIFEEYSLQIQSYDAVTNNINQALPKPQELYLRIYGSAKSSDEAERNLRNVLQELRIRNKTKEGGELEQVIKLKDKIQDAISNTFVIPNKTEKEYMTRIEIFKKFLQALLVGLKEESKSKKDGDDTELKPQKKLSELIFGVVEELSKQLEESSKLICSLLNSKFQFSIAKPECLVSKGGIKPLKEKAYKCKTCRTKYEDLGDNDVICEACKSECHKGHEIESLGTRDFVCQCQFTMRDCQLAVNCAYKSTGNSNYPIATFKCKVCEMGWNRVFCGFCAQNCHKDHGKIYNGIHSTYCDCHSLFNFCKYHQQNH